jgi:hypothetical protein
MHLNSNWKQVENKTNLFVNLTIISGYLFADLKLRARRFFVKLEGDNKTGIEICIKNVI